MTPKYRRVLLKLSGEALVGDRAFLLDPAVVSAIAAELKVLREADVEVAIVIGGGNIWRGAEVAARGMDRATADYAGMLATMINALALQDRLEQMGVITRTQTAIAVQAVAEPYIRRRAIRHLEKGRVVIFAGGTGNPYMTTDSAAALRAIEIGADVLLMAKNGADGVYDRDPNQHSDAHKFDRITYIDALNMGLRVMDSTALSLCMDNNLPIIVFSIDDAANISRVVGGDPIGTVVESEAR